MNVQFRCNEPFLPGYVDRIYVIFRILITFFFYPVNPVDPVRELRSELQPGYIFSGVQSFSYVQAPTLARPPGCTHR